MSFEVQVTIGSKADAERFRDLVGGACEVQILEKE